jgi:Adh transcription factor 1
MKRSDNEQQLFPKEEGSDGGRIMLVEEYDDEELRAYKDEENLIDTYEERIEDAMEEEYMLVEPEGSHPTEKSDPFEVYALVQDQEEEELEPEDVPRPSEPQKPTKEPPAPPAPPSPTKNIVDPDERYLMSCLPAFKRFTAQQKAYVRMAIERLFYEVEFENVSEPKNKKPRTS